MGGQDARIVKVKSAAGRCAAMNVAVSFHGRVIGKIIIELNSIIKIVKLPRRFFCADSGWFGEVGVKTFRENGDLKQDHYPPRRFTLKALEPLVPTP